MRERQIFEENMSAKIETLTIEHFKEILDKNPEISLDSAILLFENAEVKDLESFAKARGRTKDNYYKMYSKSFEQARKNKERD